MTLQHGKMARLDIYSTNRALDIVQLFLAVQTIHLYTTYVAAVESHNQAFIQTDKHLTYIVGDSYINSGVQLEIKPGSSFPDLGLQDDNFYSNNIRLDPPMLDFQDHVQSAALENVCIIILHCVLGVEKGRPVGMPRMEKVIVQNNDLKHSLHLLSISGSTVHFHCSFFQDKIVPPGGNTSFDVVFLARQVGNVENTLFIHTSIGSIRYQVYGVGFPNPYRLRPYLGARVPINSSFTPIIQMHNPYSTRLQVLEMFASEGDLHLELPSGERESTQDIWEIKPFETKAVMRASFVGRVESNHSAFIRIKTNKEDEHTSSPELLILPVEIEVSSDPGIYSPVELLDFGILRTLDEPKTLRLNLINTGPKAVHITSVNVSPPNVAVSVDFRPFKLQSDGSRPITVAHITFKAVKALQSKQFSGRIVVKTKSNNQRLVIPYQANVLHGSLVYNVNASHFFSAKALWNVTRPLIFSNTFNFSVVIYNVSLPPEVLPFFTIVNFTKPVVIQSQQSLAAFLLKFHPNQTQIHFNTVLTLSTNASTFAIPITVYNGLMKVIHHRPEKFEGQLDFGTLGVGESRSMIFTIRNDNPVDIVVARFETNMSWASVEILGIEKGNGTTLTCKHNQSEINTDPLYIKPYHYAVFNVSIVAPEEEGAYVADIWMFTQFQDLFIPIIFRAAKGSLHAIPDKFVFDKVYPGRVPYKVLQIHSTFDDYMEVTMVSFQPADPRFYFTPQNSNTVLLQPHKHSIVGKIYFDAKKDCRDDCYVGLPTFSPAGHQWLLGMSLDKDVADTDQYLFTKLQQKWNRLENLQQNTANVTIELDTNQVWGFLFSAQAHLHWPTLVKKSKIKYPLTQIGNLSVSDFIVENPGDESVLIQVLPLSLYPNPHTILDLMSQSLSQDLTDYVETDDTNTFVLYDLEPVGQKSGSPSATNVAQHRKTVENSLGVIPHKQTITALLQPGSKIKIKIGFQPKDDLARSSLIVISIRKKLNKNVMPNFTVRRPFTLRNSGELPFYIHGFSINELQCEGYGFKVLDCSAFELPPNSSRKINIAFTPDFTMSQIQRMLTIHTSLGPPANKANYSLQAMVPYDLLSQCSAALPRPNWEPLLYYIIVCLMAIIILCIMGLAYVESDRVMADYIRKRLKASNGTLTFDKGKVFDLKNVGGIVSNSVQNTTTNSSALIGKNTVSNSTSLFTNGRSLANGHIDVEKDRGNLNHLHNHANNILNPHTTSSGKTNTPNGSRNSGHNFIGRLMKMIKSVSLLKYFNSPKKTILGPQDKPPTKDSCTSPPSPVQKPTATVSALRQEPNVQQSPATSTLQDNVILSEKSIPVSTNFSSRGRKGRLNNRRQIIVDASGDTNSDHTFKKIKENKDPSPVDLNPGKRSTTAMIDDFEETPIMKYNSAMDQIDDLEDMDVKLDMFSSKLGKHRTNKHGKSKNKSDINKDRLLLCQDSSLADDGDDVSSTTTESSGGDVDDKNSLNQDNTSDITTTSIGNNSAANRRWKSKGNNKHFERLVVATHGGELVEDDSNFEVTSKSKAHRKIRVNKETFGGDIMIPSTIELPYCLPKEKEKTDNDTSKRAKKVKKNQKGKGLSHTYSHSTVDGAELSSDNGRESPPPIWDQPCLSESDLTPGDLSELSLQTESFAQKHTRPIIPNMEGVSGHHVGFGSTTNSGSGSLNFLPDCISNNSRSGSYSSIVSNSPTVHIADPLGHSNNCFSPRISGGTIGNNPMDAVRLGPTGYGAFTENGLPGIVTAGLPTSWSTGLHPLAVDSSSSYGLHHIAEYNNQSGFGLAPSRGVDTFSYGNNDLNMLYPLYAGGAPDNLNQPQLTMMQQLQVERRRRQWEHQQKVSKGEDWPGFSSPMIRNDSLWDNDYNPVEHTGWSTNTDNTPTGSILLQGKKKPGRKGFWSTLTNSASNGWSSLQSLASIWASTPQIDINSVSQGGFPPMTRTQPQTVQQMTTSTPTFNPFTSMADIWSPNSAPSGVGTSTSGSVNSMAPGQWSTMSPPSMPGNMNSPNGE